MDHHPLGLYPIAIEAFLHLCKFGVLVLPLPTLLLVTTKVPRGWLIHVILSLIVPEHHLTVQLQLCRKSSVSPEGTVCPSPTQKAAALIITASAAPASPRHTCNSDTQEQCQ